MKPTFERGSTSLPVDAGQVRAGWTAEGFSFGVFRDPPGQEWNDFVHDVDEYVLVAEGELSITVGEERSMATAGDLVRIPRGVPHSLKTTSERGSIWFTDMDLGMTDTEQLPLRAALIGTGMISLYHLRAWQAAGIQVVAVCDLDRDAADARAEEFGIKRVYDNPEALFADGGFEMVDIATSVGAHAPLARMAADHGVHVVLQKPMTETVAEAEDLVAYVGTRVRFMVHENYRFRPHYMTVRQWIDDGRIGDVRHLSIACRGSGLCPRPGADPFLVERQPYLKGFRRNLVFETMIHHLDVARAIAGPLHVVAARLNRLADGLPGEDTASILMEGDGGLIATADGCICAPGYPPLHGDRLEVIGSAGTIVMDYNRVFMVGDEDAAVEVDLLGRYQECFDTATLRFVEGVRDGTPFETDRLDNLETLRLMESVYHAAGVPVTP